MKTIYTDAAPAPIGPYSQAKQVGDLLFISGQIGLDPATGQLVAGGIEAQTRQVLANIEAILKAAGKTFDDVVKTTCLLRQIDDFAAFNAIYATAMVSNPARATFAAVLPADARVEVEVIAQ
ncbi:Rid family detoxifying hydrolase [Lacticaseibacillus daqingensis]|uniref:Rid family detoxifying hydrolase n=1 Tax=Lacticaseibacillus daqingensis TaxID=2486014 RepID=UPI000F7AA9FC|nr:Rid family detoxifying hydrolase [Lacticaseibacillus daqingensis]